MTGDPLLPFRVWPDGTVQESVEEPYPWMPDDYTTVRAESDEDARFRVFFGQPKEPIP